MENELVDESVALQKRRGKNLPIFCTLSFISLGFGAISFMLSLMGGQKNEAEMFADKMDLLDTVSANPSAERIAFLKDYFNSVEFANDNYYSILLIKVIILIVGFLGVLMMYKLKKTGFYMYLAYGAITTFLVVWSAMNAGSNAAIGSAIFSIILTVLFSIIYVGQLKRMQ